MGWLSTLASISIAIGPPLVYLDQAISIVRNKNASGFSMDICGVLIMANITRIYFWFGERFENALLIQSMLMIISQIGLLHLCLKYSESLSEQKLPLNLWRWKNIGSYTECIAAVIAFEGVLFLIFGSAPIFVETIGLVALGLESTLPIPQFITNFKRKSLRGFRYSVLAGWLFGDSYKLIYFFLQSNNSWQFKACAAFQLSIDIMILGQAFLYRKRRGTRTDDVELHEDEEALNSIRQDISR